ncbi:hypothetical protein OHA74_14425 [Streptomyces phaeochromogenes]|uniref:hypothetical protein n=1 Tax=Streptomyces phaeochromogenes TaxID=1923 RepID=UPI002E2B246A|nr:hypothetical protein [Streptomyces phaeochromogenes]
MTVLISALIGSLILAAVFYDMARLLTPSESRCPPLARIRGRRAALESAEMWLVGLRLHGRIDAAAYRTRMHSLAHGERTQGGRNG